MQKLNLHLWRSELSTIINPFTFDFGGIGVKFRLSVDIGKIRSWSSNTRHFLQEANDNKNLKQKKEYLIAQENWGSRFYTNESIWA